MGRSQAARTWGRRVAIVAAALLIALLASPLAFDRDQNGADDGGLDQCFVAVAGVLVPQAAGLFLLDWRLPHVPLLSSVRSNPRSPPSLRFVA
jgi:hypothetical protein